MGKQHAGPCGLEECPQLPHTHSTAHTVSLGPTPIPYYILDSSKIPHPPLCLKKSSESGPHCLYNLGKLIITITFSSSIKKNFLHELHGGATHRNPFPQTPSSSPFRNLPMFDPNSHCCPGKAPHSAQHPPCPIPLPFHRLPLPPDPLTVALVPCYLHHTDEPPNSRSPQLTWTSHSLQLTRASLLPPNLTSLTPPRIPFLHQHLLYSGEFPSEAPTNSPSWEPPQLPLLFHLCTDMLCSQLSSKGKGSPP